MSELGNQPAFPRSGQHGENIDGMTLRQYYAGLAMQGLLACGGNGYADEHGAQLAVKSADALIAELEK